MIVTPLARAKQVGTIFGVILAVALVLGASGWIISRFFPRQDPTPLVTARKDERTAAKASETVSKQTADANRDTTINLDLTTKEIRDAFEAPQPVPSAAAGGAAIPPAPVERMRNRLNEGIARANRAADAAAAPE